MLTTRVPVVVEDIFSVDAGYAETVDSSSDVVADPINVTVDCDDDSIAVE